MSGDPVLQVSDLLILRRGQFWDLIDRVSQAVRPGVAIFVVLTGFNLAGDGLRDALDPREH
jgi:ABC-type dipeptide/oligopeptide/nickel transport system permease subunit